MNRSAPHTSAAHTSATHTSATERTAGTGALRTSELAEAAGVNRETLRYYERRGLLADPARSLGGHRMYPPDAVDVVRAIKTAQRLGFALDEIAELLRLRHRRGHAPSSMHQRAAAKLVEVDSRIADLHAIRGALVEALDAGCDDLATCAANADCPVSAV